MSNPDSFIEEVTEEVRRDRLYGVFRKYAWVGVLLVVGIVGGTAVNEYMKSQAKAKAEAFGDAIWAATEVSDAAARRAALGAIETSGDQAALVALMLSSDPQEDRTSALAVLDSAIADPGLSPAYHDLAVLRRAILGGTEVPVADRRAALTEIAGAGRPYRVLAEEQLAYLLMEEAKVDEAIVALRALMVDQDASSSLRSRAGQVIITLGGTLEAGDAAQAAPSDG